MYANNKSRRQTLLAADIYIYMRIENEKYHSLYIYLVCTTIYLLLQWQRSRLKDLLPVVLLLYDTGVDSLCGSGFHVRTYVRTYVFVVVLVILHVCYVCCCSVFAPQMSCERQEKEAARDVSSQNAVHATTRGTGGRILDSIDYSAYVQERNDTADRPIHAGTLEEFENNFLCRWEPVQSKQWYTKMSLFAKLNQSLFTSHLRPALTTLPRCFLSIASHLLRTRTCPQHTLEEFEK